MQSVEDTPRKTQSPQTSSQAKHGHKVMDGHSANVLKSPDVMAAEKTGHYHSEEEAYICPVCEIKGLEKAMEIYIGWQDDESDRRDVIEIFCAEIQKLRGERE